MDMGLAYAALRGVTGRLSRVAQNEEKLTALLRKRAREVVRAGNNLSGSRLNALTPVCQRTNL